MPAGKKLRDERKAAGLCIKDEKPAIGGSVYCQYHRDYQRRHRALLRDKRKAAGLCECGKRPPMPGWAGCGPCVQRHRSAKWKSDTRRKDRGLCIQCGAKALSRLCSLQNSPY